MFADTLLALIALAAAIVGTLSNPKSWVKTLIISLACAAALATIVKAYGDNSDKEYMKQALDIQMANSEPPRKFTLTLEDAIKRISSKRGFQYDGAVTKKNDAGCRRSTCESIYWFTNKNDPTHRTGAYLLSADDAGALFTQYVKGKRLDKLLDEKMFEVPAPEHGHGEDEDLARRMDILDEAATMANTAMDDTLKWIKPETNIETTANPDALSVAVRATEGSNAAVVEIEKGAIERWMSLAPVSRDWEAYAYCVNQLQKRTPNR